MAVQTMARHTGPRGDIALRCRSENGVVVHELIVNGTFAMDSVDISTEQRLGQLALDSERPGPRRVLVGGLGLGHTIAAVLDHDPDHRIERIDVVELEGALVDWARAGLTPVLARVASDLRVRLVVGDVGLVLTGAAEPPGPWDAILLDVDNGPDFLIHDANAELYRAPSLRAAYSRLAPGGTLAIWCQGPAPDLLRTLQQIAPDAREHRFPVTREGRSFTYAIYTLVRVHRTWATGVLEP